MEGSKKGKSSSMMEIDQPVVAVGWSEINTSTHAEQNKEERLVQAESIMTSDNYVAAEDSLVTTTLVIHDEDKEDPRDKVNQHAIEGGSSLSNLMATYSEDEE